LHIVRVNVVYVFDVVANNTYVKRGYDFVSSNNETSIVNSNKVHNDVQFKSFESTVKVGNMFTKWDHEFSWVITVYRAECLSNNVLSSQALKHL